MGEGEGAGEGEGPDDIDAGKLVGDKAKPTSSRGRGDAPPPCCLRFLAMKPMVEVGTGLLVEIDANQAGIKVDRRLGKELEGGSGESIWHERSKGGADEDHHGS
uniref:DUF834 domain-containing protein n=1 Tax=Oryza barthii TaxID=65489 RepID=A0A0D3F9G7_9ORYZ